MVGSRRQCILGLFPLLRALFSHKCFWLGHVGHQGKEGGRKVVGRGADGSGTNSLMSAAVTSPIALLPRDASALTCIVEERCDYGVDARAAPGPAG